jgi:predicted XRE-type DNA-binding protein
MNRPESQQSSPTPRRAQPEPDTRPYFERRTDQAIERAEKATQEAMQWLERARESRVNNPEAALDAARQAGDAAQRATPVQVPRDDVPYGIITLVELISRRAEQFAVMRDWPQAAEENLHLRLLLGTLTEFIDQARHIRRTVVVQFINQGNISRKQAAEILGVHQQTIANWVKEDTPHGPEFEPITDETVQSE